ncbi:RagB/SusD family nutrient uptake outer membrane protein [Sphingobacterium alkalisoli]|uniref:RagB/SusD family nutrient uptake outer membrane protein n=1 Tax=Sphingobacterium alkalisoli TaxID=1874115 RepID=A0A4U0GUJ5_9SPHI|nr:RagB/SusD family nutrient uptake outer membrane protein [Sphingobacterium alkalisoli]TJY62761.1 RagB/SusD family nutrient uptake outer membrane protein [Sphingobacterium alkalisoli]GGH28719.1 glycan metabolism protein RagB [Sphingobacterium alkalisoli]
MKIKRITIYSVAVIILMSVVSCREYVEIDTYGTRTLKKTNDYQYLVNNKGNFETTSILPILSSDDLDGKPSVSAVNQWNQQYLNAFLWSESFFGDDQQDIGWVNLYKHIYIANEILSGVMDSEDGSTSQKQVIAAEAKVHRAFAYFSLANQYAAIYNPSSASSQEGLPLLLTPDLFQNLNRVSLQRIYDQILDDLLTSLDALPSSSTLNHHPSKIAVYLLLSRVNLTMRNFEEAGKYADMALALNPQLLNLEDYVSEIYPQPLKDPEILLSKLTAGSITGPINPELIGIYDDKDLRLTYFLENNASLGGFKYMKPTKSGSFYAVVGLSTPEIYLNRAEVYARNNDATKVVEMLNAVRQKRFKASDYIALTVSDVQTDLLQSVINERRREFVGTDLRWYDMRRFTLDGSYFKTVVREYNGQTVSLEATSPRLVFPIEQKVLDFNPEIGQNPR